jgi:hypothetical protein
MKNISHKKAQKAQKYLTGFVAESAFLFGPLCFFVADFLNRCNLRIVAKRC